MKIGGGVINIQGDMIYQVDQTALLTVYYRYCESKQALPLLNDPYAGLFLSQREKDWFQKCPPGESIILRTCLIDRLLQERIRDDHIDLVVNLGCGMDCRPYRLDLPAALKWWDVDFPHVLEHKEKILQNHQPVCQLEKIALDLRNLDERRKLTERIGREARRALIISEGVLIYLTFGQVEALARDLAHCASINHWIFDIVSPIGLQRMNKTFGQLFSTNVAFQFAPEEPVEYFTSRGWNRGTFHSLLEEGGRTGHNSPINWAHYYYSSRIKSLYQSLAGVMLLENDRIMENNDQ